MAERVRGIEDALGKLRKRKGKPRKNPDRKRRIAEADAKKREAASKPIIDIGDYRGDDR